MSRVDSTGKQPYQTSSVAEHPRHHQQKYNTALASVSEGDALNVQHNPLYSAGPSEITPRYPGQMVNLPDSTPPQFLDWQRALSTLPASALASLGQAFSAFLLTSVEDYRKANDKELCPSCGTKVSWSSAAAPTASSILSGPQQPVTVTKVGAAGQHFLTSDSTIGRTPGHDATFSQNTAESTVLRPVAAEFLGEELDAMYDQLGTGAFNPSLEATEVKMLPENVGQRAGRGAASRADSGKARAGHAESAGHYTYSVSLHQQNVSALAGGATPASEYPASVMTSPGYSPNKQYGG